MGSNLAGMRSIESGNTAELSGIEPGLYTLVGVFMDEEIMEQSPDPYTGMIVTSTMFTIEDGEKGKKVFLNF